MWNPFYGWTFVLHKRVQICYECLLFHLHQTRPHFFLTFGVIDLNDSRRGLQHPQKKELEAKKSLFFSSESSDATFCTDVEPVLQLKGLSQMSKDDTDWNLMGCKCWNETSKSAGKVLPLLSIDNRYTSCLRRKEQTCGVFGLELSVTGITNLTL